MPVTLNRPLSEQLIRVGVLTSVLHGAGPVASRVVLSVTSWRPRASTRARCSGPACRPRCAPWPESAPGWPRLGRGRRGPGQGDEEDRQQRQRQMDRSSSASWPVAWSVSGSSPALLGYGTSGCAPGPPLEDPPSFQGQRLPSILNFRPVFAARRCRGSRLNRVFRHWQATCAYWREGSTNRVRRRQPSRSAKPTRDSRRSNSGRSPGAPSRTTVRRTSSRPRETQVSRARSCSPACR